MKRALRRGVMVALVAGITSFAVHPASGQQLEGRHTMPVEQLRIYEIFESNKAAFHARFRDHAVRIMRRYNFDIKAMWETKHGGRTEFVYLLNWPDEQTMERQWIHFMADKEWVAIKAKSHAEHGELVGRIESIVLHETSYSRHM